MQAIVARFHGSFGTLEHVVDLISVGKAKVGPDSSYIPGRTSYWLNDEEISKDEFTQLQEQWVLERHRRRASA